MTVRYGCFLFPFLSIRLNLKAVLEIFLGFCVSFGLYRFVGVRSEAKPAKRSANVWLSSS